MNEISVAEQFYSVQGEGRHAGVPAVFLRTVGCNLVCGAPENWKEDPQEELEPNEDEGATWVCDTIEEWREASDSYTPRELVQEWSERGWLNHLSSPDNCHLVLTGGEPTIGMKQELLFELIGEAKSACSGFKPFVEVETNGTKQINSKFRDVVDQLNISLKLSNSGMSRERRISPSAIEQHKHLARNDDDICVDWKFVVGSREDFEEIREIIDEFDLPLDCIMVMPAGYSKEDLELTAPDVAELAKEYHYRYTPRLHVNLWDQAVGV